MYQGMPPSLRRTFEHHAQLSERPTVNQDPLLEKSDICGTFTVSVWNGDKIENNVMEVFGPFKHGERPNREYNYVMQRRHTNYMYSAWSHKPHPYFFKMTMTHRQIKLLFLGSDLSFSISRNTNNRNRFPVLSTKNGQIKTYFWSRWTAPPMPTFEEISASPMPTFEEISVPSQRPRQRAQPAPDSPMPSFGISGQPRMSPSWLLAQTNEPVDSYDLDASFSSTSTSASLDLPPVVDLSPVEYPGRILVGRAANNVDLLAEDDQLSGYDSDSLDTLVPGPPRLDEDDEMIDHENEDYKRENSPVAAVLEPLNHSLNPQSSFRAPFAFGIQIPNSTNSDAFQSLKKESLKKEYVVNNRKRKLEEEPGEEKEDEEIVVKKQKINARSCHDRNKHASCQPTKKTSGPDRGTMKTQAKDIFMKNLQNPPYGYRAIAHARELAVGTCLACVVFIIFDLFEKKKEACYWNKHQRKWVRLSDEQFNRLKELKNQGRIFCIRPGHDWCDLPEMELYKNIHSMHSADCPCSKLPFDPEEPMKFFDNYIRSTHRKKGLKDGDAKKEALEKRRKRSAKKVKKVESKHKKAKNKGSKQKTKKNGKSKRRNAKKE